MAEKVIGTILYAMCASPYVPISIIFTDQRLIIRYTNYKNMIASAIPVVGVATGAASAGAGWLATKQWHKFVEDLDSSKKPMVVSGSDGVSDGDLKTGGYSLSKGSIAYKQIKEVSFYIPDNSVDVSMYFKIWFILKTEYVIPKSALKDVKKLLSITPLAGKVKT